MILHNVVGLLHGTLGIYYARLDRVPIVILGGSGPAAHDRRRPNIDWIHSANIQGNAVRDYTKWDHEPRTIGDVPAVPARVHRIAMSEPRGPDVRRAGRRAAGDPAGRADRAAGLRPAGYPVADRPRPGGARPAGRTAVRRPPPTCYRTVRPPWSTSSANPASVVRRGGLPSCDATSAPR